MLNLEGRRIQLHYTGREAPEVLPINNGEPMDAKLVTVFGEVKHENPQGVWFELQRLWSDQIELHGPVLEGRSIYFIAWGQFRRAVLHRDNAESGPGPGQYL